MNVRSARVLLLRGLVVFGAASVCISEALSLWHGLNRWTIALCWGAVAAVCLYCVRNVRLRRPSLRPAEAAMVAAIGLIASAVAATALLSAPNSFDALTYHMPRVVAWAQNRSVAFFPTPYPQQVMFPPVAEYMMLQTYLLSGGDRFINLIQFLGFFGSVIGTSVIASEVGIPSRGQVIAALFCATLPNGILQASGAKNDCVLALWLVCMAVFALSWRRSRSRTDLLFLAAAAGLAFGTKGTAYLFAPPLVAATLPWRWWRTALPAMFAGVLAINLPQYVRNVTLTGSPLGYDSAYGDGVFRWRNEHPGWKPLVSNAVRNASQQLGARSDRWNRRVYDIALRMHAALGLDPQNPDTTWPYDRFGQPVNTNHEANANNRWHLLVIVCALALAMYDALHRHRARWLIYALGPLGGFAAFCFYLKWQLYSSRLELPLFILAAPLAAMAIARLRPCVLGLIVCALLASNARIPATQNWTRRLSDLWSHPREESYFNDIAEWNKGGAYRAAIERTVQTGCTTIGLDFRDAPLVYPAEAILLQRNQNVLFIYVKTPAAAEQPCAVICVDCGR